VKAKYPRARRIGVEKINQYLGVSRFEALRDALADTALIDASHLVDKCRLVKSPAEIECFRKAAAISDAAVLDAIKSVKIGAEDREIAAVAMASLIRNGSEYCSTWPNVMVGWRGGLAHAGWDGTKVSAGEPVAIEFAASVQRYHSPLFRTVIPGEPDKEVRRAAECAERAHNAGLAMLKAGVTIDALDRAIRAVVVELDCTKYAHSRFGYTIGVAFPPTWAQSMPVNIVPGGETMFEANMMFHVMVYLLNPASFGIGVSETVLITEMGIERLTKSPKAPVYV
jgi:Xaa-Pro dipeptidase